MPPEKQAINPAFGEQIAELLSRVAKLDDITTALLNPDWEANVGIIPEGHPLQHPDRLEPPPSPVVKLTDPTQEEQHAPVNWEARFHDRERALKAVAGAWRRAEAAIARVRAVATGVTDTFSISDYEVGKHDLAQAILAALDGAEPEKGDTAQPHASLVVQHYRNDRGQRAWVFRCWGTGTCDGWLSLGHSSEQSATRARERHVAEAHPELKPDDTDPPEPGLVDRIADTMAHPLPWPPRTLLTSPRTECALPPDHQGSYADDHTCRCWPITETTPDPAATQATDTCTSACKDTPGIRGLLEHVGIDTSGRNVTVAGRVVDTAHRHCILCGSQVQPGHNCDPANLRNVYGSLAELAERKHKRAEQLAGALREVLDMLLPRRNDHGTTIGHEPPYPITPANVNRWRAVLDGKEPADA